jgi:hypothetical protein
MKARWVRLVPLCAALVVGAGSGTALAQSAAVDCSGMHFEIANPTPFVRVNPGSFVVQGVALDAGADDGTPGVDTIDFFLGSRDAGGMLVGHAAPSSVDGLIPDSFQATITLPRTAGGQELFGYAHSSVTGEVSVLSVPIALGVDPNKAGDLLTRTPVTECRVGTVAAPPPEAAAAEFTATEEVVAPEAQSSDVDAQAGAAEAPSSGSEAPQGSSIYLDVANPSPGGFVHAGAYAIQGIAFDSAADSGPGIDHVDIFVDNRDAGGVLVGHATLGAASAQPDDPNLVGAGWSAHVVIPNKLMGPHSLFVYALSDVTGEEMTVAIPIQVVP